MSGKLAISKSSYGTYSNCSFSSASSSYAALLGSFNVSVSISSSSKSAASCSSRLDCGFLDKLWFSSSAELERLARLWMPEEPLDSSIASLISCLILSSVLFSVSSLLLPKRRKAMLFPPSLSPSPGQYRIQGDSVVDAFIDPASRYSNDKVLLWCYEINDSGQRYSYI